LKGYGVADLRLRYILKPAFLREMEVALLVNNVLNKKYEANGYTYSEQYTGDPVRYDYNYYFPQATRNYLLTLGVRF
jgi:iron complex outermembrane receptor protein